MNNSLAIYVISCHLDKQQEGDAIPSKYEVGIQAGAALTDQRTQKINDFDDFDESISDRNVRYCECSALYWVYKNATTDYIGIEHYRRRFKLSNEQLEQFMNDGVDIITTPQAEFEQSVAMHYCKSHYKADWDLLVKTVKELSPEYSVYADNFFGGKIMFPFNMSIMKRELFKEYGDWMFPILDKMYKTVQEKVDRYQRRDIGFMAERLTGLFIFKKLCEGAKVISSEMYFLSSKEWKPTDECDFSTVDSVMDACRRLYSQGKVRNMGVIAVDAIQKYNFDDKAIISVKNIMMTEASERQNIPQSLFEYMPDELKKDLDSLIEAYNTLEDVIEAMVIENNAEIIELCKEYLTVTGFSVFAIINICNDKKIDSNTIFSMLGII